MPTTFMTGSLTFLRFKVSGNRPRMFDDRYLDQLTHHAIGRQRIARADGSEIGWIAGDHILDVSFGLEKNVVNEALQFAMRVDTNKPPADLLQAYTKAEIKALAADNPSGFASNRQKREARATAKERIEQEAKDGKFLKRKGVPILWDSSTNEVLIGTTSATDVSRVCELFEQTFERKLALQRATERAFALAEAAGAAAGIDGAGPSKFVPHGGDTVDWVPDMFGRDFLGNEFLLWLWWHLDVIDDTVNLMDGSGATTMIARSLILDCPRGQTGRDGFRSDGPTRLPEARRAIESGKLPRKAGLTIVRHDQQFELTWHAETLALTGVKLPASEADEARARLEERITNIRTLIETADLLYGEFIRLRAAESWTKTLNEMKEWLSNGASMAKSA